MRQWLVDPRLLCSQHLRGEHLEHHMFVGSINKGISVDGYISDGLLCPDLLRIRHDELAKEMLNRGGNHGSPLPNIDWDAFKRRNKFSVTENRVDLKHNLEDLSNRCKDCRARIIEEIGDLHYMTRRT